ncbi:hypothetical protein OJAG_20460 [Oerskovia enterophila]|uniref:Uncharacterized protein n=1 Tax=Oerskovia enterophila TaxID=43678 RepID=A0A161YGT6_9CELL|nr:hypothetical protein OJAG_20460 [Oerskovia enterophila]
MMPGAAHRGGTVAVGDVIGVELPVGPHHRLQMV